MRKQDLAKLIVEAAGKRWLSAYISSGSTVTSGGLSAVLSAVKTLKPKAELLSQIHESLAMSRHSPLKYPMNIPELLRISGELDLTIKPGTHKRDIPKLIVEAAGIDWLPNYISSAGAVTSEGLSAVLSAVKTLKPKAECST